MSEHNSQTYSPLKCPGPLQARIEKEIPLLEGWTTPERCVEMATLILRYKILNYVEIGVFGGRSLIAAGMAMEEKESGRAYGIDPWQKQAALEGVKEPENVDWWSKLDIHNIHRGCMDAIWKCHLEKRCIVIRSDASYCTKLFGHLGVDMLFIDGNHSEEASCRDVRMWKDKVRPGGFILFDDSDWPSTQKALGLLAEGTTIYHDGGHYRIYRKKFPRLDANVKMQAHNAEEQSRREDEEWQKTHPDN